MRGVTFDVHRGENLGLVGESGCGKSTLSRLLSWVEQPDEGRITFKGRDIAAMSKAELLAMRKGFQLLAAGPVQLPAAEPADRPEHRPAAWRSTVAAAAARSPRRSTR